MKQRAVSMLLAASLCACGGNVADGGETTSGTGGSGGTAGSGVMAPTNAQGGIGAGGSVAVGEVPAGDGDPLPATVQEVVTATGMAGDVIPQGAEVASYANQYGMPLAPRDTVDDFAFRTVCNGAAGVTAINDSLACWQYYRCQIQCERDDECDVGQAIGVCSNRVCRPTCSGDAPCPTGMICYDEGEGASCYWPAKVREPCSF